MTKDVDDAIGEFSQDDLIKLAAEVLSRVDATRENAQSFLDTLAIQQSVSDENPGGICGQIMVISAEASKDMDEDERDIGGSD